MICGARGLWAQPHCSLPARARKSGSENRKPTASNRTRACAPVQIYVVAIGIANLGNSPATRDGPCAGLALNALASADPRRSMRFVGFP